MSYHTVAFEHGAYFWLFIQDDEELQFNIDTHPTYEGAEVEARQLAKERGETFIPPEVALSGGGPKCAKLRSIIREAYLRRVTRRS